MTTARSMQAFRSAPWSRTPLRNRPGTGRPRRDARGLSSAAGVRTGESQVWDHDQEPDLDSLLTDPLVGLVMNRDGLSPEDVAHCVSLARKRLASAAA